MAQRPNGMRVAALAILVIVGVMASACGGPSIVVKPCPPPPPPPPPRQLSLGETLLFDTPMNRPWFDACQREWLTLVAEFDESERYEPHFPREVATYVDLLAKIYAIHANARALDTGTDRMDPRTPEQTPQEILDQCHDLLEGPLEAFRPRRANTMPVD